MKVAYSTNAWGDCYAHVMAANNVNYAYYMTSGSELDAIAAIARAGFERVEIFDGMLLKYEDDDTVLRDKMQQSGVELTGVYSAGSFIYDEILEEEYYKISRTMKIASRLGARNLVLGGGALRYDGIREEDYEKLARALDHLADMAEEMGMIASYHPHMGSLVETPAQIDKIMELSKISLCPDCGHVKRGGGDPYQVTKKYIDRIKYFHLKGAEEDGTFCGLKKGVIDFDPIMELLVSRPEIELCVEDDGTRADPEQEALETAEYLKTWVGE